MIYASKLSNYFCWTASIKRSVICLGRVIAPPTTVQCTPKSLTFLYISGVMTLPSAITFALTFSNTSLKIQNHFQRECVPLYKTYTHVMLCQCNQSLNDLH